MSVSRTAGYVALCRALESIERARAPLFQDPFATAFVPSNLKAALRLARVPFAHRLLSRYLDRRAPGVRTSAIARTRFIDDVVRSRVDAGVRQLVILGAGFDCRAHRLPELRDTTVFEVDRADTQRAKRDVVARMPNARTDVIYVAVDFEHDVLGERLAGELADSLAGGVGSALGGAGWDAELPTTFIWEGVTNYLVESAVAAVLGWIGTSAVGSTVVFTYIHKGLLDGTAYFDGGDLMIQTVKTLGEPWTFGLYPESVASFLSPFGLVLGENLGADDYRARYLPAAEARGYAFYRIAVAERG